MIPGRLGTNPSHPTLVGDNGVANRHPNAKKTLSELAPTLANSRDMTQHSSHRPATWAVVFAFVLIYLSWGTTFLAIRDGVYHEHLPPALFGGSRVALAGLILLGYLWLRGEPLRFTLPAFQWVALTSLLLFVGGNGLITTAERTVESGVASVLASTTPLWLALMEMFWPRGERLSLRGWLGLLLGLAGMLVMLGPTIERPAVLLSDPGPLLVIGSAVSWALGSLVSRYHRPQGSHLAAAAYQMVVGGTCLTLIGLMIGEARELSTDQLTGRAVFSYLYLLIVGSLVGFVAFNWLLGHVSATLVGTYAYVNPVIAILVGWLVGGEAITGRVVAGVAVILSGVALVRAGHCPLPPAPVVDETVTRGLTGFWNLNAPAGTPAEEP